MRYIHISYVYSFNEALYKQLQSVDLKALENSIVKSNGLLAKELKETNDLGTNIKHNMTDNQ